MEFDLREELKALAESRRQYDEIGSDSPIWRGRVLQSHGEANLDRDIDFLMRIQRELRESERD